MGIGVSREHNVFGLLFIFLEDQPQNFRFSSEKKGAPGNSTPADCLAEPTNQSESSWSV